MGSNVPDGRLNQIQWFEDRIAQWTAAPTAIGLTSAMVADFSTLLTDARNSFTATQTTRAIAKNATQDFYSKSDTMRTSGGELVNTIKTFAQATDDPTVYTTANVSPAKDTRTPAPAPIQPFDIKTSLNNDGSVQISFKGAGPTGTLYSVYSKPFGNPSFTFIGQADAEAKTFTDTTVTPGTQSVTYMVQAVRGGQVSPWSEQVTAQFGLGDGGVAMPLAA
jgi:hypothetical protein